MDKIGQKIYEYYEEINQGIRELMIKDTQGYKWG